MSVLPANVGPSDGVIERLDHVMHAFDAAPAPVRRALNDCTNKWSPIEVRRFMIERHMTPDVFVGGLEIMDRRSQWRYELAAFNGFPPGWQRWPLPTTPPFQSA